MVPAARGTTPRTASSSSRWPLPDTPATPTSSPARTRKVASRRRTAPSVPWTVTPETARAGAARGGVRSAGSGGGTAPTMWVMRSSSVWSSADAPTSTLCPRRRIVRRSATARVSRSLWVMSTRPRPESRRRDTVSSSASASCGARALVGSSRMTTRASSMSTRRISTSWRSAIDRSRTTRSGATSRPCSSAAASRRARSAAGRRRPLPSASCTFSSTVRAGTSRRSWNTMPIPAARAAVGDPSSMASPSRSTSPSWGWFTP